MRRLLLTSIAVLLMFGFVAAPEASAQQSVNIFLGGFVPRTLDARAVDDVIFNDSTFLSTLRSPAGINIREFNQVTFGGEWLVGIGPLFDAGLGLSFYQRTVPTFYTYLVNDVDNSNIRQDLKLRIVPFTATFRMYPFGRRAPIQPYFGGGAGVYMWRYSETGQFVIDDQGDISVVNHVGKGSETAPLVLGGLRVPMGYNGGAIGFEIRWQDATASLPDGQGFAGSKIDLGGVSYLLTINIKF
jgi:hypothetical protein